MTTKAKPAPSLSMFDTVAASNKGARIELMTATGEPSGVFVSILGPDSDEARAQERKARTKMLEDIRKQRKYDADKDAVELLVACITGWENMPGYPDFSKDSARDLLERYPSIRRQLEAEQADVRNFIKG